MALSRLLRASFSLMIVMRPFGLITLMAYIHFNPFFFCFTFIKRERELHPNNDPQKAYTILARLISQETPSEYKLLQANNLRPGAANKYREMEITKWQLK